MIILKVTITPQRLEGTLPAIASKSQAHRMLICAALAKTPTRIVCATTSKDIEATADCMRSLGAEITYSDGVYTVIPAVSVPKTAELDCGESGSTLRFLLPVVCALGVQARIKLHGRLPERPLSPLWEELERHGAILGWAQRDILTVSGSLAGGDYEIAANISSQFISGLLLALPLIGGGKIKLLGNIESAGYIDMTLKAQRAFGVCPELVEDTFAVPGTDYVSPGDLVVEGDWSNAAFWVVADRLSGGNVRCTGLDPESAQGDRAVIEAADLICSGDAVVDAKDIPDLVPVLAVLGALTPGTTEFINAGRLRIKESDRIKAVKTLLQNLGSQVTETAEGLIIKGSGALPGGVVDSFGDHRIAMSAAIASIGCTGTVTVTGAQAVSKSYPDFWRDFSALGGKITEEDD